MKSNNNKKYKLLSNIMYALANIWNWDRTFYLYFVILLPVSVILSVMNIYFPKILIDSLMGKYQFSRVVAIICTYFVFSFCLTLIRLFCNAKLSSRKYSISYRYQNEIWKKYMRTDFPNTDSPQENLKLQNAINDATGTCSPEFIWRSIFDLLKSALGVITYGAIIISFSPSILLALFFSACVTYLIGRWEKNYYERNKDHIASLDRKIGYLSRLSSDFDSAKDIRIFDLGPWINSKITTLHDEKEKWQKKANWRSYLCRGYEALLTLVREGLAYALLTIMLLENKIETGDFVFLFGTVTGFSAWLNGISNKFNELVSRSIKIGYYRDYFDIRDKFNHGLGCALPSKCDFPMRIEFVNVSYKYSSAKEDDYALKKINLKINPGQKIAIVGENGAGKTTLVKLLCGLYYPTIGTVRINGKDVSEYNIDEYYSMFSVVFQDVYMLPITIKEFISSCEETTNVERVNAVISQVGLTEKINALEKGIDTHLVKGVYDDSVDLSGGEKQKLVLARALYKDAPIIVFDEPTSALDPIAENDLYIKYSEFARGKTSIYISHRLASTRFCDRIIYVKNGEIAEMGSHEELMKLKGQYYAMFELQSQYYREDEVK